MELNLEKWSGMEPEGTEEENGMVLREGKPAVYDFPCTADLRFFDGIAVRTKAVGREDLRLDVILRPLGAGRPEFIMQAEASVCLSGAGGIHRLPFAAFDHSTLVSAHMKYISSIELLLQREGERGAEPPAALPIGGAELFCGKSFRVKARCASAAADAGEAVSWTVILENRTGKELLLSAAEKRHGRESFPLSYERKLTLAADEVRETTVYAVIPESLAAGGCEERTLLWLPCGADVPAQEVTLYAARRMEHPFLLHTGEGWGYLAERISEDEALAGQLKEEYLEEAERFCVPEPSEDESFVFVSSIQDSFLKTAVAWKLTGRRNLLDKLIAFLRGFLDERHGYLNTRYIYFQFIESRQELKKGCADGASKPFAVRRACSAGWVQEAEFMTKLAFVCDLLWDREEFTPDMRGRMEQCMRSYMEFEDWRLTDGDGNNFQLAEAAASLYFACLLQDRVMEERFLSGTNGLYELIGSVFSDEGGYFEGATNYVRLAAEILLYAANACENCGLNLKDVIVPASCDRLILHAPWARKEEWAEDGKPFLGMSFARFESVKKPVRRLKDFIDHLTQLLTPEGILFSVNDSNEQSLIPIMDLACYLYGDPACCRFCDPEQRGDLLFGRHMAGWQKRGRKAGLSFAGKDFVILREKKESFTQAVMKVGQHGGYHGHYDRLSLVSLIRDNQTFHNQEFAWFGYDSFLFKMWVQASAAHNMVVVDRRMQEPSPCEVVHFEENEDFCAVCAQTVCRWSDPPYGGQTPYPLRFPEEKCEAEGRYILKPEKPRAQGAIGEYSEPILQRRLLILMEGCCYIWDYLRAEHEHEFDCLYHPFGSTETENMIYTGNAERFDTDPFGAGQFVTDCHWYETHGTARLVFRNHQKRVNPNDRIDFTEYTQLFCSYPPEGCVMTGRYPDRSDTFRTVRISGERDFLKSPCKKTVAFHQKGTEARFVTAIETGAKEGSIRGMASSGYEILTVQKKDGTRLEITVQGMDDSSRGQITVRCRKA